MIYEALTHINSNDIYAGFVWFSWDHYFENAFYGPDEDVIYITDFKVRGGRTYAERKAKARDLIIDVQAHLAPDLTYGEIADISAELQTIAKRYGLLTECRENGII